MTKDQIKEHVREYKALYITGSLGAIAGFTYVIMRGQYADVPRASEIHRVAVRPLTFFSVRTNNVVTVVERSGRGHPGYIVRCLETGEVFPSQQAAAQSVQAYPSIMSSHLKGMQPDVFGKHFERLPAYG